MLNRLSSALYERVYGGLCDCNCIDSKSGFAMSLGACVTEGECNKKCTALHINDAICY